VSVAASLLVTSSDPFAAVNQLSRLANPRGRLLIIEATPRIKVRDTSEDKLAGALLPAYSVSLVTAIHSRPVLAWS
jgi:hypothetical protein